MERGRGQVVRILRRGTALGLALASLWVIGRTADLAFAARAVDTLSQDAAFALALLQAELPGGRQAGPDWQALVLGQSPLLAAAGELPAPRPAEREPEPAPGDSSTPPEAEPEPREDDPLPLPPEEDSSVVAQTFMPTTSQTYLRAGDIYVANRAGREVDMAVLAAAPVNITLGQGPQILIVHTHGSEAYTQSGADVYQESDPYRTTDCNYNVVRVGEEMARVFQEYGFSVIHDTNLYDYPVYSGAYDRSLEAVERWVSQYPSIQIILDVHRDALAAEDGTIYKAVSREEGQQVAQVMLVVGTDSAKYYHPLWQENLTFAMRLQQQLLDDYESLARPMVLRSSRYNQQMSVGSLLIEVGTHGNTLEEAVAGARLFAESAVKVLDTLK